MHHELNIEVVDILLFVVVRKSVARIDFEA